MIPSSVALGNTRVVKKYIEARFVKEPVLSISPFDSINGKIPQPPPGENRPHDDSDNPKRVEPIRLDAISNLIQI